MPNSMITRHFHALAILVCVGIASAGQAGVNYEEEPINYGKTEPSNAVSQLQSQLDAATRPLKFDESHGYLRSLLDRLAIPTSSQVLTFAKTSLQAHHISPATPRALYFNDDIHLGYVQEGMIEIAVSDPALGMAFYTLEQSATDKPLFKHNANNCLTCHGAARTRNVPGLQIRSVFPDSKGQPVIAAGSIRTDHASPFEKRWGGWYVTGKHGSQKHLGNFTLLDPKKPRTFDNAAGQNVTDLSSRFDTTKYLTAHSDLVALLVLEHQTDAHNFITLANFETRHALYVQEQLLKEPHAVASEIHKLTENRIEKAGDALVRYLLFSGEAPLMGQVEGTSDFAREFAARGPRDRLGRSLRDFDLSTRIFRHPCSYLIYSHAFDALPKDMKHFVYRRLQSVLSAAEPGQEYSHLTPGDRQAILSILMETKPDFAIAVTASGKERP